MEAEFDCSLHFSKWLKWCQNVGQVPSYVKYAGALYTAVCTGCSRKSCRGQGIESWGWHRELGLGIESWGETYRTGLRHRELCGT